MQNKQQPCSLVISTISRAATAALAIPIVFALMMVLTPDRIGLDSQCSFSTSRGRSGPLGR